MENPASYDTYVIVLVLVGRNVHQGMFTQAEWGQEGFILFSNLSSWCHQMAKSYWRHAAEMLVFTISYWDEQYKKAEGLGGGHKGCCSLNFSEQLKSSFMSKLLSHEILGKL